MATILTIADAVVGELNAAAFGQPVTADRHYQPTYDLQEMGTLHVSVVPRGLASKAFDRGRDSFDYLIDVGVQQKTDMSQATLDALMQLVEEIADHLRKMPLNGLPAARCVEVKNEPVFSPEHLERLHQFTSILTLTYRLVR